MNYSELREFLKKNPYCFQPLEERKREFDQKVNTTEGKIIQFVESQGGRRNLDA
ncbi:MAG: hypothetical protein GX115_12365 [Ruminiclostridium sp.]|nr:hypothetical protein [Ruminiclostridium sp.]